MRPALLFHTSSGVVLCLCRWLCLYDDSAGTFKLYLQKVLRVFGSEAPPNPLKQSILNMDFNIYFQ